MSTKHTPGPWYAARLDDVARNGSPILAADRWVGVYFAHGQNGKANARLISAAPELLAALEAFLGARSSGPDSYAMDEVEHMARAAISKAGAAQ